MLKNIDPILSPDLLQVLAAMGHGDDIVVVDANFPADSVARQTVTGKLIRLDGVDAVQAVSAILSVFPLDSFVEAPARRMEIVGAPDEIPEVQQEVQREIDDAEGQSLPMASVERFAFSEEAKKAYAVVATTEGRAYGCFMLKKGVIFF